MSDRYVYFIKPVHASGPIKIGIANVPSDRLKWLQARASEKLEIVGYVPGIQPDETYLHQQLFHHKSHGEWFHATPEVLAAVSQVLTAGRVERNIKLATFIRRPESAA